MPTLLFSVWQFLVIFTILPIESVWCAVSQHTFIREETRLRMGRECRRPGSAQEENGWTLPWWQVILLVIASSGFFGGGGCLSCSTQLGSHGTKFYIHDHDMGGFRCKYIYFDTGPPEPMKKWWLSKKKRGGCRVNLIFHFIFQNKFQREEYFVCMTFYTYSPLDLCFTWMYTNERKKEDLLTPY